MEESPKAYARVTAIRAHIDGDVNIVYPEVVAWFEAYQISDNQIRSGGGTGRESLGRMGKRTYLCTLHYALSRLNLLQSIGNLRGGSNVPPGLDCNR